MVAVLGALDLYLRSYNEVTETAELGGIKTRIGDYVSREPIGTLPIWLIWSLKKWPDRNTCLSDPKRVLLKWSEFSGVRDVQVCLTRVLNGAQTLEAASILTQNGFSRPIVLDGDRLGKGGTTVSASCGKTDQPCGSAVANFWSLILKPYEFSVSISRSGQQVVDVKVIPSIL